MIRHTTDYDERTGEKIRSTEKHFAPAFDEEKGYLFWARKSFTKSFADVDFPPEMNDLEVGRMARLAKKIWSNTNMLGYRGNGGVKAYNLDKIAQILNLQPRQAYRFIEKMIRLGILAKVKIKTGETEETQLYVNPMYFFSSNRINLNLYLLFHKQLDKYIPEYAKEEYRRQKGFYG